MEDEGVAQLSRCLLGALFHLVEVGVAGMLGHQSDSVALTSSGGRSCFHAALRQQHLGVGRAGDAQLVADFKHVSAGQGGIVTPGRVGGVEDSPVCRGVAIVLVGQLAQPVGSLHDVVLITLHLRTDGCHRGQHDQQRESYQHINQPFHRNSSLH